MIPLYKLEKLPRIQKLRKIAKYFSFADNRLCTASVKSITIFSNNELIFFADAAKLLSKDDFFSSQAKKVFTDAVKTFSTEDITLFHRSLNDIKHILLAETGKDQADWDFTDSSGCLDISKRRIFDGMWVYMEDIRSPFNVGAMFRSAESFGVEKILLSPFCADPKHPRAQRTAMGCIDIIPWEKCDLFSNENKPDIPVFALETGGIPINEFPFPRRALMIAGSEELGVSPRALACADVSLGRVSIPCFGVKASLNVSVAFGIALQAWAQAVLK
ncbi:MAG: TrmH family RNA methyltransferase [Treponema sp.]|nr:TrmH family RNA methyltransferase [Treponema sp.]